jgi:hypothetical protein
VGRGGGKSGSGRWVKDFRGQLEAIGLNGDASWPGVKRVI